ncbi:MAG: heme-copper oxidase subunit III [Cyanobacteria bacterium REEB67]|nr:heme-copper oxidase subunit III [Cyanobacteria bacterium REEB67]
MTSSSPALVVKKQSPIDRTILGMILFVASESIFFLLLLLAYVNFHKDTGAQAAALLDPIKTGMFSVALFSSSFTLMLAEKAREKASENGAERNQAEKKSVLVNVWLLVTVVLGAVFLTGQGLEYAGLLTHNVTISRDMFGSSFFTLTGFHGFHVFIGLVLLTVLLCLSAFGRNNEPTIPCMKSIAIYWHFVDVVWIVIFSVVYLWRYV